MKVVKRMLAVIVIAAVMVTALPNIVEAKTKPVLNKKKVTLTITNTKKNPKATLKVKGVSGKIAKKAKWATSNKKVATVKKGKVTAKKAGKATITCKVQGRRLTCKITVNDKRRTENVSELPDSKSMEIIIKRASQNGGDNQIIVMYDGKDVTNDVKYVTKYKVWDPYPRYVESPGIIRNTKGNVIWLTALYGNEKKTVKIVKTPMYDTYIECYCGATFYDDEDAVCARAKHITPHVEPSFTCADANPLECTCGDNGPTCQGKKYDSHAHKYKCGGCYIVPYVRYLDLVIE